MAHWRSRVREVTNSTVADLGTVFLGAAAILLTRVIPEESFTNFNPGLLAVCVALVLVGIALRAVARPALVPMSSLRIPNSRQGKDIA